MYQNHVGIFMMILSGNNCNKFTSILQYSLPLKRRTKIDLKLIYTSYYFDIYLL